MITGFLRCVLLVFVGVLAADEVVVDLVDPVYADGVLSTDSGGVIKTDEIRVQAKSIRYNNTEGERKLFASGDLLINYSGRFFVGSEIEYDFETSTGIVKDGISDVGKLFVKGGEIKFTPDGKFEIDKASVTSGESRECQLFLCADKVVSNDDGIARAEGISPKAYDVPLMWVPFGSVDTGMKPEKSQPARFKLTWESGSGPLFIYNQQLLDHENMKASVRGELRSFKGLAGAVDSDHHFFANQYVVQTRNFYAHDTFKGKGNISPTGSRHRYRLQGRCATKFENSKIDSYAMWDFMCDKDMKNDYQIQNDLGNGGRTEGMIRFRQDDISVKMFANPRINNFQYITQELPSLTVSSQPYSLGAGLFFEEFFKLSMLNQLYPNYVEPKVVGCESARVEACHRMYRSFSIGPLVCTPSVGVRDVYYSKSRDGSGVNNFAFNYGFESRMRFLKNYGGFTHSVCPFVDFEGIASRWSDNTFIFQLDDAFGNINQVKCGLKNCFFTQNLGSSFDFDVGLCSVFGKKTISRPYIDCRYGVSQTELQGKIVFCDRKGGVDFVSSSIAHTVNEYFAFSTEVRYRGPYCLRKADKQNYLLDLTRKQSELVNSPLSDSNVAILTKCQMELPAMCVVQLQNYVGWRDKLGIYNETKVDIKTVIYNMFQLKLSYSRTLGNNTLSAEISLI